MSIDPIEETYRAAARELGAFLLAVTHIFGKEHTGLAEDIWLQSIERYEGNSGIAGKDMRCVTYLAASQMARHASHLGFIEEERFSGSTANLDSASFLSRATGTRIE